MLVRCYDADVVNYLANHPEIRPHVGPLEIGALDMTAAVADPQNVFLIGEHGGFALVWTAPWTYEVHVFMLQDGLGKWSFRALADMLDFMEAEGALMLWARIDPSRPNVKAFARRGGFRPTGQMIDTFGSQLATFYREL